MANIVINYNKRLRPDLSNLGLLLLVGDKAIRQFFLYEKDIGWLVFWEFDPKILESLWLMASAVWGEITLAEGLCDWGRQAMALLNDTLSYALHGKPRSG
jgi:hypothetical protein